MAYGLRGLLCGLMAPLPWAWGISKHHDSGSRDRESREFQVGGGRKGPGIRYTLQGMPVVAQSTSHQSLPPNNSPLSWELVSALHILESNHLSVVSSAGNETFITWSWGHFISKPYHHNLLIFGVWGCAQGCQKVWAGKHLQCLLQGIHKSWAVPLPHTCLGEWHRFWVYVYVRWWGMCPFTLSFFLLG